MRRTQADAQAQGTFIAFFSSFSFLSLPNFSHGFCGSTSQDFSQNAPECLKKRLRRLKEVTK
jgi:hypothetical protein